MGIVYRVATGKDFEEILGLGQQVRRLSFPTIVAETDNKIIGYITSQDNEYQVVCGPLYVKKGWNRGHIALKLMELYERVLRGFGITQYRFAVHQELESYAKVIKRIGLFEYEGMTNEKHIFKRVL